MEDNKPIDGAEYISLEDAQRLKLPYFKGLAAGYPSPANPDFKPIIIDADDQFILQGKVTSIHRDTRKY